MHISSVCACVCVCVCVCVCACVVCASVCVCSQLALVRPRVLVRVRDNRVLIIAYSYSVNRCTLVNMAWRRNEIAVKCLESKDKGKINRVNVKHVLGDLSCATEGSEFVVKFGSRRYRATIIDLLVQKEQGHPRG